MSKKFQITLKLSMSFRLKNFFISVVISTQVTSAPLKRCILEIDLEYSKELHEFQDDYRLDQDKLEIKREVMSHY